MSYVLIVQACYFLCSKVDKIVLKFLIYKNEIISDIDDCSPNPCENGGSCEDQVAGYTCDCEPGWGDVNCTTGKLNYITYIIHANYSLFSETVTIL